MKKEVWITDSGHLVSKEYSFKSTLFGYIEVGEPKKTVTKEWPVFDEMRCSASNIFLTKSIPVGAKNVRILFDVEE